jgi:hypothetical protein
MSDPMCARCWRSVDDWGDLCPHCQTTRPRRRRAKIGTFDDWVLLLIAGVIVGGCALLAAPLFAG